MGKKLLLAFGIFCIAVFVFLVGFEVARVMVLSPAARKEGWLGRPPVRALSLLQIPCLRPSSGLAWSKQHYPDEYSSDNVATAEFVGLDDTVHERFMDIGARAYSQQFNARFSYFNPALRVPKVHVEYLRKAEAFAGRIVASGLKPNFAYQVKLRGIFQDREAFERIGYVGRWRLPGEGTNYLDRNYMEYDEKDKVESYILFDFFITDPDGNATKDFYLDSTLHVLWSATNQRQPGPLDSRTVVVTREGSDPAAYANVLQTFDDEYEIFAESEQNALKEDNRPPIGEAFLPAGKYTAEVVLTEESFHSYGDAGYWATVMAAPVSFEIVKTPRPSPFWSENRHDVVSTLSVKNAVIERADTPQSSDRYNSLEAISAAVAADPDINFPRVSFVEAMDLPPGKRYVFSAELRTDPDASWRILVDTGSGFKTGEKVRFRINGQGRWRMCDVEIHPVPDGHKARIALEPLTMTGVFGIRDPSVCAVEEK